jgi:hypothetical protein
LIDSSDAAATHLTNAFWYIDNGDMLPFDPFADAADTTYNGFVTRWNLRKQRLECMEIYIQACKTFVSI